MASANRRPAAYGGYTNTRAYYTDGSAARAVRAEDTSERRTNRRRVRKVNPRHMEAERTASVTLSLPITLLLLTAVVITLFFGYRYLCLKSSLDSHMNTIKQLEADLDTLRTENDSLERSIDTSVNLNYVYNYAVNELGMVHAGQDNTILYDKTESEYVKQYENIPSAQ